MSGELPEGWVLARVDEFAQQVQYGSSSKTSEAPMVPVLRMGNIHEGRLRFDDLKYLPEDHAEFPELLLEPGDVLFNRTNSPELVGKTAVYGGQAKGQPDPCSFASYLLRVRCGPVLPEVLSHYLNSATGKAWIRSQVSQQVGQANVNGTKLKGMELPLAPLNEQKRIVDQIDALTEKSREAREALDEVPALLDQLRQSILAAAFRGDLTKKWREQNPDVEPASVLLERIRKERRKKWEEAELAKFKAKGKVPQDDKWKAKYKEPEPVDTNGLPELPEGWCWSSVDELTIMSGGITKGQKRKGDVQTRPVPYLRVANVQRGSLRLDEVSEIEATDDEIVQLRLLPGDLLLNEGGDLDKLGRGWVWDGQIDPCIHQNHVFRARPVSSELSPQFISHFTNTFGQAYFLNTGKQTTNLASVSMTRVKACPVPLAPAEEMQVVVQVVAEALELVSGLSAGQEVAEDQLRTLDSSILAKAFRGELVPQDPNDEPASVLLERIRKEREGAGLSKKSRAKKKS